MSVYDVNRNSDEILIRGVIVALLSEFNKKLSYEERSPEYGEKTVDVSFFFGFGNDERYLQDLFLNEYKKGERQDEQEANGLYEQIPRGILKVQNMTVISDELTNNYVRGQYQKEENGQLLTYTANIVRVPLKLPCTVSVHVDTITQQFKVIQGIIENLWKQGDFKVDVNNVKVPGRYVIEDDFEKERQMDFSYSDKEASYPTVDFNLTVYVEYPVFKGDTEIFAGKTMQDLQRSITLEQFQPDEENEGGQRANYDDLSKLNRDSEEKRVNEGKQKDLKVGGGDPRVRGNNPHDKKWHDVWPHEGDSKPPNGGQTDSD